MTDVDPMAGLWDTFEVPTLLHAFRWGVDADAIAYRLQNDPQFAAEMRLCKEWRIPHSEFLNWSPEDQKKALGHFFFEAMRCGSCGIHPTDWPDPEEAAFEATALFCPGCAELAKYDRWAREQAETTHSPDAMDGQKPYLKKCRPDA